VSYYYLLYHALMQEITLLSWRAITEIGLLSLACFILLRWLSRDNAPLLESFCMYSTLAAAGWFFNLPTITFIMWYASPLCIIMLMLIHHHTLQRHYITWRNSGRSLSETESWTNTLIKLTLRAWSKQTSMFWIIERTHSLQPLFNNGGTLYAPLTPHLIEILLSQHTAHEQITLWMNVSGTVIAHNPNLSLATPLHEVQGAQELTSLPELLRTVTMLSTSYDCLVVYGDALSRTYIISAHGTYQRNLTSQQVLIMLHRLLNTTEYDICKKSSPHSLEQNRRKQSGHAASDHSGGL